VLAIRFILCLREILPLSLLDETNRGANCRKRAESGRIVVSVKDPERI
jgi:hypothetical protein